MAKQQPINAEVPAGREGDADRVPPPEPPRKRNRVPVPLPLKLIGGALLLAAVFIFAAILGGGGTEGSRVSGAAPPVSGGQAEHGRSRPQAGQSTTTLGYPAFATKNTTRVGGADPAANAAGVALAVFPSTKSGPRPAAVTLVEEGDPAGAIAASVLMAAPLRAPILFSGPAGMPAVSEEALGALDPQGSKATGGAALFAVGNLTVPAGADATRVRAGSSAATAAAVEHLRESLAGAPQHIVVAPQEDLSFAMPAAAWAARSGDPVLFAEKHSLPQPTAAALRRHPRVPVYVLGPSSAISSSVIRRIAAIVHRVRRVSGQDPVSNAIALARYHDGEFGWDINDPGHGFVVARSNSPLDAAAASPLSASGTWGPLLLTDDADTVPAALHGYMLDVKPGYTTDPTRAFYNHVWLIGDQEAIAVEQQAEIDELAELAKIGGTGP
ncbi:MAG: cell wall-binding repeat-containing protein [Solirubrobacterales bacterium]